MLLLQNVGEMILYLMLLTLVTAIGSKVLSCLRAKLPKAPIARRKLLAFLTRFFLEVYLEVSLCAMLNFYHKPTSAGEALSLAVSVVLMLVCVWLPLSGLLNLLRPSFFSTPLTLVASEFEGRVNVEYQTLFCMRRLQIPLSAFFLRATPQIQLLTV